MSLLRNVLIFHSGALGDFVLSLPVALALARLYPTSRVRYVTAASKGRLAGRVVGVEYADVEAGFSSLFAEGAAVPESVASMLAGSHRVVTFVAGPGDVWSKRVAELAPRAAVTYLRTVPDAAPDGVPVHAADWICRQISSDRAVAGAVEQILAVVRRQGLVRRPVGGRGVLIHPGAGAERKCWPLDRYRELALRLKDPASPAGPEDVRWVLGEVERERMPAAHRRALEALGDVVVPHDYSGLLEELVGARLFVGNDSGPAHLAAMAGVPTVALFGPTDPAVWSPVGPAVTVVRSPTPDLDALPLDAVNSAVHAAAHPTPARPAT